MVVGPDGADVPVRMRNDFVFLMLQEVDVLISPSRYLAESYRRAGFGRSRIVVLPYGVDLDRFGRDRSPRRGRSALRLAFVGSLYPHKGPRILAEAVSMLPDEPQVEVSFVGSGDQISVCREILDEVRGTHEVRFHGRVDHSEIEALHLSTDVLVVPSIWPENHPVTITEAFAAGNPVVASRIGGIPELVEPGANGLLFEPGNSRELADRLRALTEARELLEELSAGARRTAERLCLERQVDQLVRIYRQLSAAGSTSAKRPRRLVVCSGDLTDEDSEVMAAFAPDEGWRFVHRDWIDEGLEEATWIRWVHASDEPEAPGDGPALVEYPHPSLPTDGLDRGILFHRDGPEARSLLEVLDRRTRGDEAVEAPASPGPAAG